MPGRRAPPGIRRLHRTPTAVMPRVNDGSGSASTRLATMSRDGRRDGHDRRDDCAGLVRRDAGPDEHRRAAAREPQTRSGAHRAGPPIVAVGRGRCIDDVLAQVVEVRLGYLCPSGSEQQDVAIANTVLVQRHRLIERRTVESRQRPSLGEIVIGRATVRPPTRSTMHGRISPSSSRVGKARSNRDRTQVRCVCTVTRHRSTTVM